MSAKNDKRRDSERAVAPPPDHEIEAVLREVTGEVSQEVIEIAGEDAERSEAAEAELRREKDRQPESFYSGLVFTLAGIRYSEAEAKLVWVNLLSHKWEMSQKMGRNVGIRVAALDFFSNVMGELARARIMDSSGYIQTARLAVTDGLTGLYNHRYMMERLRRDLERARESGERLSVLMIDIDHFKAYNDINGHMAGDVALKEVAAVIRSSAKREDVCARYGGEEFAVIAYGTDRALAARVAERLRAEVEARDFPNEEVLPGGNLTVSCGVATYPEDATDRGGLVEYADRALYAAKNLGRNRVCSVVTERRGLERVQRPLQLAFRSRASEGAGGQMTPARLVNISLRGACLETGGPVEPDTLLEVRVSDRRGGSEVDLLARTIWSRSARDGVWECGVKFVGVAPEAEGAIGRLIREGAGDV